MFLRRIVPSAGAVLLTLPVALMLAGCTSLQSISILPATGSVTLTSIGQTAQFTAVGTGQMGSAAPTTTNITTQVTWASANPNVATINSSGLATAVGAGHTQISAESAGMIATSDVTVTIASGPGGGSGTPYLNITPTSSTDTFIGETTQFLATGNLSGSGSAQDLTSQVTWSSSNAQVATITSQGLATVVGAGTTNIVAQSGGVIQSATLNVTIASNSSAASIAIVPTSATATFAGETTQFIALGNLTPGTPTVNLTGSIAWSSSNVAVATVDQNGLATAVGTNIATETTTITAIGTTSGGSSITASATLVVPPTGNVVTLPTLAVYMTGLGTGTITSPSAISCGVANGTCTDNFPKGSTVTLTATPAAGSSFGGWSSNCTPVSSSATDPTSGQHLQCSVTMNNNLTVGGIFNH